MEQKERMVTWQTVIPSETMKMYLKKVGNQFTDAQLAAMIYGHGIWDLQEKCEMLSRLAHETEDETVSDRIKSYLNYLDIAYQVFTETDENYVFVVFAQHKKGKKRSLVGIYRAYDQILEFIKNDPNYMFHIKKRILIHQKADLEFDYFPDDSVTIDSEVHLKEFQTTSFEQEELDALFPFAYVPVLDPFYRGDTVKILGADQYGIVMGHKDMEEKSMHLKEQVSSIKNGCISFQDLYVCVSILSEDGWTWNQKLSPYILEKIEFSDKDPRRDLFDKAKIILDVNEEPSFCRMQNFVAATSLFLEQERERKRYERF